MFIASGTLSSNLKHIISKHKWGISGDHPEFLKLKLYKHCTFDWIFSFFLNATKHCFVFPDSSDGKESTCNVGDPGSIPGSGRSAGEGKGYPLQCSDLENSMDSIVHWVAKSQTCHSVIHSRYQYMCFSIFLYLNLY